MSKIATLVGCAIGDTMGAPTKMTMALSASLLEKGGFDSEDVAKKYIAWYELGNPIGIGTSNRVSPIGLFYRHDYAKLMECAMLDASITHNAFEPKMGSVAVALAVSFLANGTHSNSTVLEEVKAILAPSEVLTKLEIASAHLKDGTPADRALASIGTSGYVPETVGAAFYCLGATDNFKDAVVMAVKGGGDTDTTAAIVGAMAGTFYGIDSIPEEYKSVENFDLLQGLTDQLINNGI